MITFPCASCEKKFTVKDELAGKRTKCPGCGNSLVVPQPAAIVSGQGKPRGSGFDEERTLPSGVSVEAPDRTLPPKNRSQAAQESLSGEGNQTAVGAVGAERKTATQGPPTEGPSRELYDFLSPAQQPDEIGRLGPFRVLKVLGAGGMGVVYKAEDPQLKRPVALKAMLPTLGASESARKRFLREAQAAAAIVHDHIVQIFQVGEDRGVPFVAMQFLEGEPLDERLKRENPLPLAEVLRIGRETAEGLAAAHKRGLMHRDIKPANLWLEGEKRRVKILDFGLARAAADDAHLTQTGAIIGTPAYMAPEQAAGENVDQRCDLFSLGCVLYRMCTGNMPFKGKDTISTLVAVATESPPPPVAVNLDLPTELSDLVMELLEKKPAKRPPSAQAVAEALQEIEAEVARRPAPKKGTTARPLLKTQRRNEEGKTRIETAPPKRSRSFTTKRFPLPWLIGGGLAGVGGLALLLILLLRLGGDESGPPDGGPPDGKKPDGLAKTFTNTLGMEFVLVPKGKSWLGGGGGKPGKKEVEVLHDFYLGKYEVTQEEWEEVTGQTPSHFSRTGAGKDAVKDIPDADQKRFPVKSVSWDDAQDFVKVLNEKAKEVGWTYRLPKEAEWEYACRGGPMANKFDSGYDYYFEKPTNELLPKLANFAAEAGKGQKRTCKVGSYPPNRLGLFDMHGNVWEWCAEIGKPRWEKPVEEASQRVIRGGCWTHPSDECQAGMHNANVRSNRVPNVGLRLARVPVGKEIVKLVSPKKATDPPAQAFALAFDGKGHVEFPSLQLDPDAPFTIEAWVTPGAVVKDKVVLLRFLPQVILGTDFEPTQWHLFVRQAAGAVIVHGPPVEANQLVHLAAVRDGRDLRFYVNGKLVDKKMLAAGPLLKATEGAGIGGRKDRPYAGLVREVHISATARYDKDFAPAKRFSPDAKTIALYHCDEGQGDVLKDSSGNKHDGKIEGARWLQVSGVRQGARRAAADGTKFTAHVFDPGRGGKAILIEGELSGNAITWRDPWGPGTVLMVSGTLKGDEIRFTFTGLDGGAGHLKRA